MTALLVWLFLFTSPTRASTLQDGLNLMKAERFSEAIRAFEAEMQANPGSAEVLMNLGWSYWRVGRVDRAWRCFELLVQLDPKNPVYLRLLADIENARKNYGRALGLSSRALGVLPGDRDASMALSQAFVGLGRHREADRILTGLVERYPDSPEVRYRLADNLALMGQLNSAIHHFDVLLRLAPGSGDYRRSRAGVLYGLGRVDEAIVEWKALAEADPPDLKAMINLGWASWHKRDFETAFVYGSRLVSLEPDRPVTLRFLANIQIERGVPAAALRLAQRILDIAGKDKDASLLKAKALFHLQRDGEAMAVLRRLVREHPRDRLIVFHMADFLDQIDRKLEALEFFDRLVRSYPQNAAYRKRRARLHYELGRYDEAILEWRRLAKERPYDAEPVEQLLEDAMARRDWKEAFAWIRELSGIRALDAGGWLKLTSILRELGRYKEALAAVDKAIALDPSTLSGHYFKAEIYEKLEDWSSARTIYEVILTHTPNSMRALAALGRVSEMLRDYERAIRVVQTMRRMAFSDTDASPHLRIVEARLWADYGNIEKGMSVLRPALKKKRSIPSLLYHGVSPHDRGDWMSISRANFRAQMRAIKQAGYTAITVAELERFARGVGPMPDKPILIAFDDARNDAFDNADPILEELGFKATMFVHLSGLRKTRFHAGYERLKKWQATGRWELQAHGDRAHELIVIDAAGRKGHFLANRQWLAKLRRLETDLEFETRIEEELRFARDKLQNLFPERKVIGFAFPFGDNGQFEMSNMPRAGEINERVATKNFRFLFIQDGEGFSRVPGRLREIYRFEVGKFMTAEKLIEHLRMREPWVRARTLEAQLWNRTAQPTRSLSIFNDLQRRGYGSSVLYAGKGGAYRMARNLEESEKLLRRAAGEDPENDRYPQAIAQSKAISTPFLATGVETLSDTYSINTKALARAEARAKTATLQAWGGRNKYEELNTTPLDPSDMRLGVDVVIRAREYGTRLNWWALPRVELAGGVWRREFEGVGMSESIGYSASATAPLIRGWRVIGRMGYSNIETAAAIRTGGHARLYGGGLAWDPRVNWAFNVDYDKTAYTDGNRSAALGARLSKRFFAGRLSLGYAFRRVESERRANQYYSPERLAQHMGLVSVGGSIGGVSPRTGRRPLDLRAFYSGGYGFEDRENRAIHSVGALGAWRIVDHLELTAEWRFLRSARYIARELNLGMGYRF